MLIYLKSDDTLWNIQGVEFIVYNKDKLLHLINLNSFDL